MTICDFFGICGENIERVFVQTAAGNEKKLREIGIFFHETLEIIRENQYNISVVEILHF